ncbi:hypothetical protein PsAD2_01978 [Pseudovibrio axinellae]|uniref:Uncharacterized protein n=1 Tax=Pseudovibrio axinellae TaxID=989403 RepID=A0A165YTR0_9HYPH|nr:hypothetical protein [Pseudovibrio axinellae]KZL19227.1 hypothetical protein PsAD2_01978 [Pseudovibrio axinellae]SEQ45140.1 hypothetical protein SAMN05421798_102729 [Pseudovibrio axinellae]
MRMHLLAAAVIAFSVGYTSPVEFSSVPASAGLFLSIGQANAQNAQRNTARRTARRTSRRTNAYVNYRQSISGCRPYNAYYNCGGVYYRAVQQNGATVYVVVNP